MLFALSINSQNTKCKIYSKLKNYLNNSVDKFSSIDKNRKQLLDSLVLEIKGNKNILFTGYTNTRRTQLCQVWLQTSLLYYNLENKYIPLSAGNIDTKISSNIFKTLSKVGFNLLNSNSEYHQINIGECESYILFSKNSNNDLLPNITYNISISEKNEENDFKKINFNLPYKTTLTYDDSPSELKMYSLLSEQVSLEMLYLAFKLKENDSSIIQKHD